MYVIAAADGDGDASPDVTPSFSSSDYLQELSEF